MQTYSMLLIGCCCLLLMCSGDDTVSLRVDFSSRPVWHYDLFLSLAGEAAMADSQFNMASTLETRLAGTPDGTDGQKLILRPSDVVVSSPHLSGVDNRNLKARIEQSQFYISSEKGVLGLPDSALTTSFGIDEWNLYRHFVKLVPSLPQSPVSEGFQWEREKIIPVSTVHGDITAVLFQAYTIDSVRTYTDKTIAYMSWSFNYTLQESDSDGAGPLSTMSKRGRGIGAARINVSDKELLDARVEFTVPQTDLPSVTVDWKESASLTLVE